MGCVGERYLLVVIYMFFIIKWVFFEICDKLKIYRILLYIILYIYIIYIYNLFNIVD